MFEPDSSASPAPAARRRRAAAAVRASRPPIAPLPDWARGEAASPLGAGFAAGAALFALDALLRSGEGGAEPPFAGALRQRLALKAAAVSARLLRRREEEAALRDAEHLALGADPGPAGRLHRLWRQLAEGRASLSAAGLAQAADLLDVASPGAFEAPPRGDPLGVAAAVSARAAAGFAAAPRGEADCLAFWAADLSLADALGWARPIPLLMTQALDPKLRRGAAGRRPDPRDADWPQRMADTYALAARQAHQTARELSRGAEALLAVAPKLRAKGSARVVDMLLSDDCVSPARASKFSTLSDRGARRLFDRLIALGAARELTGRPQFRLYGL